MEEVIIDAEVEETPAVVKSSYSTGYDLEKELIKFTMVNVWGAIEPSEVPGYHNYSLMMVRKALVDMIAHLAATLITYDHAKGIPVEASADEIGARIKEILKNWIEEGKKDVEGEPSCEVCGGAVSDNDGQEGNGGEGGLPGGVRDPLPVSGQPEN